MHNVVIIGFGKSATTTIHKALSKSGYNSFHQNVKSLQLTVPSMMKESYQTYGDPYRTFSDMQPYALTQLDYTNPTKGQVSWPQLDYDMMRDGFYRNESIRYVLNYREPYSLVDSFFRWKDGQFIDRLVRSDLPGLPPGTGDDVETMAKWISNHYDTCREIFGDDDRFIEIDIDSNYFRSDLENFLEITLKWWGVANRNV